MRQDRIARWIAALILFLVVVAPLFADGVGLLVDWLWFGHEGYREIYLTILRTEIGLSGYCGLGFIVLAAVNLWIARSIARRAGYHVFSQVVEFPAIDRFNKLFRGLVWLGVLLAGYFAGEWATSHWLDYLFFTHAVHMAARDPIFGFNLGFFMFRLPFLFFLFHFGLALLIVCLLTAGFLYFIDGGVWISPRGLSMVRGARIHLMALGGLFFLLFAWRARLAMYNLVYSPRGLVFGAGYTDMHAVYPVLWILLVLCVVTALTFFSAPWLRGIRPPLFAIGAVIVVAIVGAGIYPAIIENYVVKPNELQKEEPYIARGIKFTRQAYALNRFDERNFPDIQDLTPASIQENEATMRNIRLWDHQPLLTTFAQLQEIRTYYDFVRVYNDRYTIHSDIRQVSLSARELSSDSLPDPNWVNQHLIYTHGYGICMGPVNESSPDGLPVLFIKNIPPESDIALKVTRPEIYYGELSNNYCIVKTKAKEFDYPSGEDNVYSVYQGSGGIRISSVWRRLLFAIHFGDINVLLTGYITPQSRIMIYRRILDRASRLAPFLSFDSHPYLVVTDDGRLDWILDAYTTSAQYPYSEPTSGVGNYIRNSVKVVIDAYSGQTTFYISDPTDPLIQAYARIFPGVFHPLSEMPADLRAHIRYPQDFFAIQAAKYAVYHMTDPRVFYSKEDLWRVAGRVANGQVQPLEPYYTIMKLPEVGTTEEFILMVPFTPARKNNMIAWMAARCDGKNYGKVLVFTFPKDKLIFGPEQIQSRINQNPTISQQLTLWDQGGSKVIRGTLLVIPVQNAVLYVEPLYLAAQAGASLPELKRVIVAYSDHVVMEPTLDEALDAIFGASAAPTSGEAAASAPTPGAATSGVAPPSAVKGIPSNVQALIEQANQHYVNAQQDLRKGDWTGYGQELKALGQVLQKMRVK